MKNNKGITLIALIITIIVLLILAGVSIAMLAGENNIFGRATEAATNTKLTNVQDLIGVEVSEAITAYYNKAYVNTAATDGDDNPTLAITNAVKKVTLPTGVKAEWTLEADTADDNTYTGKASDGSFSSYSYEIPTGQKARIKLTLDGVETVGTFNGLALTWTAPK